ncbi:MAG: DMT family transporter [Lachnospiraceae bacterium]|nr:DMT family transporter [Lachnospiraceae bacterium]
MYYIILLIAGILQGAMNSLNAQLGEHFSLFGVTFFVHSIALVILLFYLLAIKKEKLRFSGVPWYIYLVGVMGIGIVASSSWVTMHIGAGTLMAISTLGQLLSSEFIDALGLFGMEKVLPDRRQIPGFLIVAAGVALVIIF